MLRLPPGDLVAQPRGQLVLLGRHGVGQLLGERPADVVVLAQPLLQLAKLVDHLVVFDSSSPSTSS